MHLDLNSKPFIPLLPQLVCNHGNHGMVSMTKSVCFTSVGVRLRRTLTNALLHPVNSSLYTDPSGVAQWYIIFIMYWIQIWSESCGFVSHYLGILSESCGFVPTILASVTRSSHKDSTSVGKALLRLVQSYYNMIFLCIPCELSRILWCTYVHTKVNLSYHCFLSLSVTMVITVWLKWPHLYVLQYSSTAKKDSYQCITTSCKFLFL